MVGRTRKIRRVFVCSLVLLAGSAFTGCPMWSYYYSISANPTEVTFSVVSTETQTETISVQFERGETTPVEADANARWEARASIFPTGTEFDRLEEQIDWLTVEPANGAVNVADGVTLTVTFDPVAFAAYEEVGENVKYGIDIFAYMEGQISRTLNTVNITIVRE